MGERRTWEELMQRAGTPLPETPAPEKMSRSSKVVMAVLLVTLGLLGLYYATKAEPFDHPTDDHIEADLLAAGVDPVLAHGLAHDYAWEETCTEEDAWRRTILMRLVSEGSPLGDPLLTMSQAQEYNRAIDRECQEVIGGGDE